MNKISPNRQKKEQIVAKLSEKVSRAKGLVFTNYQGLTHVQLEKFKKALREANAELVVTKNTLLKLALGKVSSAKVSKDEKVSKVSNGERAPSDTSDTLKPFDTLKNATATLFLYADPIEPLRQLAKTIKQLNLPVIKFGIIDGKSLTSEQVLTLATLPAFDVLMAQFIGQLKTPIYKLHRALGWNIQKLVMTLKQIENSKS